MSSIDSPSTDGSLIRRAGQDDPEAWRSLVELLGPVVYAWARRRGLNPDDAADVMQETFAATARGINGFCSAGAGSFRGWLWTVTMNKIRDQSRRRRSHPPAVGGTDMQLRLADLPAAPPDPTSDDASRRDH